jgi:hypothetical protein
MPTLTKKTLEMRVMERCVELLGSHEAVARHLRISQHDLTLWIEGLERPTRGLFLAAIDILTDRSDEEGLGSLHSLQPDHHDPLAFLTTERKSALGGKPKAG